MKQSIVLIYVLFFFNLRVDLSGAISEHDEVQSLTEEERKILMDCEHSDYRTYIKCLKRHKRHHNLPGNGKVCLEECFDMNCSTPKCADDCYVKCKRKVRLEENYSRTIEADPDCTHDKCNDRPVIHNIDTTVNVNNSLGGNISAILNELRPKIEINNIINNDGNSHENCCPGNCCRGNAVPNVFSISMMTGYGSWPLIMPPMIPYPLLNPTPNINCSLCGTLIFKYRCDITCVNETQTQPPKTDRPLIDPVRCRSPSCIGGT